jgi:hypothetical protein
MNANNEEEFSCTRMQHNKHAIHASDSVHKEKDLKYLEPFRTREEPVPY